MILKVISNPNDSVLLAGCVNPIPQHSGCVLELKGRQVWIGHTDFFIHYYVFPK